MNDCAKYEEWISLSLDGELTESQKTELAAHLELCPRCRRLDEAFRAVSSTLEPTQAPGGFAGDVMSAIRSSQIPAEVPKKEKKPHLKIYKFIAAAACVALCIFAFGRWQSVRNMYTAGNAAPEEPSPAMFGMMGGAARANSMDDGEMQSRDVTVEAPQEAPDPETVKNAPAAPDESKESGAGSFVYYCGTLSVTVYSKKTEESTTLTGNRAEELLKLLEAHTAAAYPDGEADYELSFNTDTEQSIDVWLTDEGVVVLDAGEAYVAEGSEEEFLSAIG